LQDRASQVEKRRYWDAAAETFDDEPDHGLRDPMVRNAWTNLLGGLLPPRSRVLDLGCGTGSLSVLLANIGHHVIGADLSTAMIRIARSKAAAAGQDIPFYVCDVSHPGLRTRQFDSILCRHVLWSLTNPGAVLARWAALLKPHGRFILIEGYWHTGGGLHAEEVAAALPPGVASSTVFNLSPNAAYWGKTAADERYAVVAEI